MALLSLFLVPAADADSTALDRAFERFWAAEKRGAMSRASEGILALEPDFADLLARLEAGRPYSDRVKTGRLLRSRLTHFHYLLLVPSSYDPARRYPLRFYLHGGVNRPAPRRRDGSWWRGDPEATDEDHLVVVPVAWNEAMWWHQNQAESLPAILQAVRREYNVDENRTSLLGISDGGTGAYFHALTGPTPWATFVSLIGHARVLANPTLGVNSQLYSSNLAGRAIYAVNGGKDPLYPTAVVEPMMRHFAALGAEVVFRPKPQAGHDLSWLSEEQQAIESFLNSHPRDPLPDRLSWETDNVKRRGRYHWLRITELGSTQGDSELPDPDVFPNLPQLNLGFLPVRQESSLPGVLVASVERRSASARAGIKPGDRLLRVGETPVADLQALATELDRQGNFGQTLDLTIDRQGRQLQLTLQLPAAPRGQAPAQIFPRKRPTGRVDVVRNGSHIAALSRGVRRFKLLLSPRQFDLAQPIRVTVNGRVAFHGQVVIDPATLLRLAVIDQDRTQLYAAELEIEVPSIPPPRPASSH